MDKTARELLAEMQSVDIRTVDPNTLQDIRDVKIDSSLTTEQKMVEYLKQIKNPYCYKHGKYVVKVRFSDTGISLEERLADYIRIKTRHRVS